MCGIAGIVNYKDSVDLDCVKNMMQSMKHRGPDDEGVFLENNIGLGFVRLSIIDLSISGHQPMYSSDGRYIIAFNGEVYNYLEIQSLLIEKYQFKSSTDTEVVLNSYIEWGESCLDRFNGMFSFVIYDRQEKKLFGARDRFGIKPFYYYFDHFKFVFASEIPALLTIPNIPITANESVIFNYLLTNRTNYSEETFFNNIFKLKSGEKFTFQNHDLKVEKWYKLEKENYGKGFEEDDEYLEMFKNSIDLQLRSDVPIGVCLSGGLDSSSILSLLINEFRISNTHTYSAVYNEGAVGDESKFINVFKGKVSNMHFTHPTYSSLLSDLDEYVKALCEPIPGTSEYAEFKVMKLAHENSKVILNGQGADEVLGGYDYFYSAYLKELMCKFKLATFLKESISLFHLNKLKITYKYLFFFLLPTNLKLFALKKRTNIFNKKTYKKNKYEAHILTNNYYKFKDLRTFFQNHFKYKFEHHLIWADKSGMHFSIECRFPFLDHNLVEKTIATESKKILKGGWTKNILREALKGKLDDRIRLRKDKIGFETPESDWIKTEEFKKYILEIFASNSFNNRRYFDSEKVKMLYKMHLNGSVNSSNAVWKVIHLELWLRNFIDPYNEKIKSNYDFAIVTPVKNESGFIEQTIESVINQTILPKVWIIVDDGSQDNTTDIVKKYTAKYNWIKLIEVDNKQERRSGGSKVIKAFYVGLREIDISKIGFIVKLDGDLILPKNYFELNIKEFKKNSNLGICGGTIYNRISDTKLVKERVPSYHVRGALKMIRKECWDQIQGFKTIWNWDGLDIMEAKHQNWDTKSIDLKVIHLRPTSSLYKSTEHAFKSGYEAYKLGTDFILVLIRSFFKINKSDFLKSSLFYIQGYFLAKKNKEPRIISLSLIYFINQFHYKRIINLCKW